MFPVAGTTVAVQLLARGAAYAQRRRMLNLKIR